MRLWTYQHPAVLQTLQGGERYQCSWALESNERWLNAYRWMVEQMNRQGIESGEYAPVWAWHSVNRIGGKPDSDCAHALLTGMQLTQGIDLLELEVPDHLALVSDYGYWNQILDSFIDGVAPNAQDVVDCFAVSLRPRRGRPPQYFPEIQACVPYLEPAWLVSWEILDTKRMLEEQQAMQAEAQNFLETYKSVQWEFESKGSLLVKLTKK